MKPRGAGSARIARKRRLIGRGRLPEFAGILPESGKRSEHTETRLEKDFAAESQSLPGYSVVGPFAMKITDFRDMSGKISFVQAGLMACCIAVAVQCRAPKVVLYDYGTGQKETIDRKIIEHEIRNPDLKRLLKEFDDTYDDSTEVRGEGLNLSCDIYSDSICYTIDYTTNISYAGPTIVCEPVNGKEVTMTVRDLWNDIRLLPARSNELLKDSNPEEYRDNKELEKQIRWGKGSWVIPMIIKTGSLPQWIVTFDRNGKLLRVKR